MVRISYGGTAAQNNRRHGEDHPDCASLGQSTCRRWKGVCLLHTGAALLDVDGDGVLEVVLGWQLNTVGVGLSIYQVTGGKVSMVLTKGEGE